MENYERKCKFCVTFGKCNKKYCIIILLSIIIQLMSLFLIVALDIFQAKFEKDIKAIFNCFAYLFYLNLAESLMFIPDLFLKTNISVKIGYENESSEPKKKKGIEYIFNDYSVTFTRKDILYFFVFLFLKLILETTKSAYLFFRKTEFKFDFYSLFTYALQFELIFLFILSKKMNSIHFYRHQYFSIISLTILGLARVIISGIESEIVYFLIDLGAQIIYSFINSLITLYIAGLMEYKYISPYKACYIFGLINFIIVTVLFFIPTFIPCEGKYCFAEFNEKKYYANLFAIFNVGSIFIFVIFLLKAILLTLNYYTINKFSVFHSFLLLNFTELFSLIGVNIENFILKIIYIIIFCFFGIFFVLLFLEIIELNLCGMSFNIKKYIEKRMDFENSSFLINDDETIVDGKEGANENDGKEETENKAETEVKEGNNNNEETEDKE